MMVPKKSLILAGTLLFAGSAFAQNQDHKQFRVGKNNAFTEATLNLQTGVITRGPQIQQKSAGSFTTTESFDNLDFAGFVGVDSGPNGILGPIAWATSGDKGAPPVFPNSRKVGGQSKFVQSFVFAYCSAVRSTLSGGTGAAMTLEFFEGYTPGLANSSGPTGTSVSAFNLTGLPASTGTSGFLGNGFANCAVVLIRIDLTNGGTAAPMCLDDTTLGYSYQFDDLDSGGILGGTAVFLGCVQSCSGSGPDSLGMTDNIDVYIAGAYATSFAFSTSGNYPSNRSSVAIALEEPTAISTAATIFNGSGVNTAGHDVTVVNPPILGTPYGTSIDCSAFTPGFFAAFTIGFIPGTPFVLGGTKGELLTTLIPGTNVSFIIGDHLGGVATRFAPPVPKDLSFYGFAIEEQGFCGGSSGGTVTNLTTAISLCVGSE